MNCGRELLVAVKAKNLNLKFMARKEWEILTTIVTCGFIFFNTKILAKMFRIFLFEENDKKIIFGLKKLLKKFLTSKTLRGRS